MTSGFRVATAGAVCAASIVGTASADFLGWTSTVRAAPGGFLVNVFAATSASSDVLLNVYGGTPGTPSAGTITTGAPGGFLHADGALGVWAPPAATPSQSWNTLDSFLTIGGNFNAGTGEWFANGDSTGDPPWNVTYFDSAVGGEVTVNAFRVPSNSTGFTNPFINSIPRTGGVYIAGTSSPARSLAGASGIRAESSNAAAAAAQFGVLVGQFWVPASASSTVNFTNMGATIKRADNTLSQAQFALAVSTPVPPPDADGDGVTDGSDNCPTVANPSQADCNQNGIGDACESFADCNENGIPDSCDIATGTSNDVNGNGTPDDCEIDCDDNGIPDAFEIAGGGTPDCNADGIPDTCQGAVLVFEATENLGAPSGTEVRTHTFANLPLAADTVTLVVQLVGDLNGATEWVDVTVGSLPAVRLFGPDGNDCPDVPDTQTFAFSASEFNALVGANGSITVSLVCPSTVDATECKGSGSTRLTLAFTGIGPNGDCDGNQRLDVCDVAAGGVPDCNGNGRPDSCDIAGGKAGDCNANGIPDSCELAANPAIDCDGNGIIDSCDIASQGVVVDCDSNGRIDSCQVAEDPSSDCNSNGRPDSCDIANGTSFDIDGNAEPDECQTVTVPGAFATIQAAIDAAPASEMRIVQLSAGTYPGPVAFNGKPIVLRGVGAAQTILEGNAGQLVSVVRFTGGEPGIAAIERLTVRGGTTGTLLPGTSFFLGGGVFGQDSFAKIRQCVIENNASAFGGGVYLLRCTTVVSNTIIRANNANSDGGGLQANGGAVNVIDTVIENNFCNARGGGMHLVQGLPLLFRVTVRNNVSNNLIGGVSWYSIGAADALLRMEACTVTGNSALVTQGGIGVSEAISLPPTLTLAGTNACSNVPRPNVAGRWIDGGGNVVCDCEGDLFPDGLVNGIDLGVLLGQWGNCTGACESDLNDDGTVNGLDLGILLGDWGSCG
jgi:hypothetical protein